MWVRDLKLPMHLELVNGHFVPHVKSCAPLYIISVPDGPQANALNVLWLQVNRWYLRESFANGHKI